jgi:glutaminase
MTRAEGNRRMHVCAIEHEHVIASVTAGCEVFTAGDITTEVAIQSISKVFTMAHVIEFTTGLPAKSGVGGGLIAVSPGKLGIAVVSPPPDDAGNSVRARGNRRQFKTPSGAIRWPQRHASGGRNV